MVRTHPEDDRDRRVLDDVKQHGWHVIMIDEDEVGPGYCFSLGMYHTLDVPEMCIFGLRSTDAMAHIINHIGALMKSGEVFTDWRASEDVLDGYSCVFREVKPELYGEYFGYTQWFYEGNDFPMLQCVWPDAGHRFPWDDGYQGEAQPLLAEESAWPFLAAKNTAVFTTCRVLDDGYPILLVTHDEDGDWQFLCNTTNDTDDARVVCLKHIVDDDPSLIELADLAPGWQAARDAPDQPWERFESADPS